MCVEPVLCVCNKTTATEIYSSGKVAFTDGKE